MLRGLVELEACNETAELFALPAQVSKLRPFEVYSIRHTFLTRLGESGRDVWTLARVRDTRTSASRNATFTPPRMQC